jgi:hypothetical protein
MFDLILIRRFVSLSSSGKHVTRHFVTYDSSTFCWQRVLNGVSFRSLKRQVETDER